MKTQANDPAKVECEIEKDVIDYFGLDSSTVTENTPIVTDFGQIVNIMAMFLDRFKSQEVAVSGDIDILPAFPDLDKEEECETRCSSCGVCLDNEREYLQIEGYCDDCL